MSDHALQYALEADRLHTELDDLQQVSNCIRAVHEIMADGPVTPILGWNDPRVIRLGEIHLLFGVALDALGDPFRPSHPWTDRPGGFSRLGISVRPDGTALEVAPDWLYHIECLMARVARRLEALQRGSRTLVRLANTVEPAEPDAEITPNEDAVALAGIFDENASAVIRAARQPGKTVDVRMRDVAGMVGLQNTVPWLASKWASLLGDCDESAVRHAPFWRNELADAKRRSRLPG
jgi:hypothetical protein